MWHSGARFKIFQIVVSILKRQVNSLSNFASLFIVMIHNFSVNFKLMHFLLWMKVSHQGSIFWTFECSGKSLPNSRCLFPIHQLVYFQILHQSSVSWNITPQYFFRSKIIYFAQKRPIRIEILRIASAQVKIWQIFVIFETTNQVFFKFSIPFQCHET